MSTHGIHELTYDFWCLDLWDWAMDLVRNPLLAPYFEWYAQKLFKYDGMEYVRFIDEPWTADWWYEIQVRGPLVQSRHHLNTIELVGPPSQCKTIMLDCLC